MDLGDTAPEKGQIKNVIVMRKRFALRFRVSMSQRALHVFAANTT